MGIDLSNKFDFAGNGTTGTATKNSTTNIDFKVTESTGVFLKGGMLLVKDHVWGDWFEAQVVDVDNILGYGAGTVLKSYIKKWYVHPDSPKLELNVPYAGQILQNLYIRIKYHSVGTVNDVGVAVNYDLHIPE